MQQLVSAVAGLGLAEAAAPATDVPARRVGRGLAHVLTVAGVVVGDVRGQRCEFGPSQESPLGDPVCAVVRPGGRRSLACQHDAGERSRRRKCEQQYARLLGEEVTWLFNIPRCLD